MSMQLTELIPFLEAAELSGDGRPMVWDITYDSRKVVPGVIFAAIQGEKSDGHNFVRKAVEAGAAAVLIERPLDFDPGVPAILVSDTKKALGIISAVLHDHPSRKMVLIGITGTNGKTTLTYLLESILRQAGSNPGVIGTVAYRWNNHELPAPNTTPEASDLQQLFSKMAEEGVTHCLMEVSSHGLHRGRLEGCDFDIGVFTNLSQDHLDYHGDLEEYFAAKRILFDRLLPESFKTDTTSIINVDDEYGRRLCLDTKIKKLFTFGFESNAQIRPGKMKLDPSGLDGVIATPSGDIDVISGLIGNFNLSNILAAVAVAEALNIDHDAISKGIKSLKNVPGRLERVHAGKGSVFVDYAHTPHAVKNVLSALASMRTGRIITIIGCGGDRDKSKRPLMGKEAALGSDVVILTSDNPRSEDASVIAAQTEAGITECGMTPLNSNGARHGYEVIIDRRRAIARALEIMGADDILLVAGKGHETYQEISGVRYPFDDRKVVHEEALATGLIKARVQD